MTGVSRILFLFQECSCPSIKQNPSTINPWIVQTNFQVILGPLQREIPHDLPYMILLKTIDFGTEHVTYQNSICICTVSYEENLKIQTYHTFWEDLNPLRQ